MFRRVSVGLSALAVALAATAGVAAARPADPASPTPTAAATATTTSVSIESDGLHLPGDSITVVASLKPDAAYGKVSLYDAGTLVATGSNYRIRWTYATTALATGTHHLTVDFAPAAGTGFAPSTGSIDYVVDGPATPTASPTPTVSPTRSTAPKPSHSASPSAKPRPSRTETQIAVGTVPSATPAVVVSASGGTRTPSPTTTSATTSTASPVPSALASGGTRQAKSGKGALPFTGFNAARTVDVALALFCVGMVLVFVARVRRARQARRNEAG